MNQTIETGDIRKAGSNLHENDLLSTYTFVKVLLYRTSSPITPRINAGSFRGGLFQNSKKPVNCMFDGLLFHSDWKLLDYQDSNLDKQNQNLLCYHYTTIDDTIHFFWQWTGFLYLKISKYQIYFRRPFLLSFSFDSM